MSGEVVRVVAPIAPVIIPLAVGAGSSFTVAAPEFVDLSAETPGFHTVDLTGLSAATQSVVVAPPSGDDSTVEFSLPDAESARLPIWFRIVQPLSGGVATNYHTEQTTADGPANSVAVLYTSSNDPAPAWRWIGFGGSAGGGVTPQELADAIAAHIAATDPHGDRAYAAGVAATAQAAAIAASQPLDADLTAIAALATTAFGRAFLTLANAAAARAAIGTGRVVNTDGLGDTIYIGAAAPSSPATGDVWLVP